MKIKSADSITRISDFFYRLSGCFTSKKKKSAQPRLILKDGKININYYNAYRNPLINNLFVLASVSSWTRISIMYICTFAFTWIVFAIFYYLVSRQHGDYNDNTNNVTECIHNLKDFVSAVLFSIETQHTIGYGGRWPSTECVGTLTLLIIQSIMALFIQHITAQAVYIKFAKPRSRIACNLLFTPRAIVFRKGKYYRFVLQVVDLDRQEIINAKIHMCCFKERVTSEGEEIMFHCYHMKHERYFMRPLLSFPLPILIEHIIDESSPLYGVNFEELHNESFEIVVSIAGTHQNTGFPCHFRSSYLPSEIDLADSVSFRKAISSFYDSSWARLSFIMFRDYKFDSDDEPFIKAEKNSLTQCHREDGEQLALLLGPP